MVSAMGGTTLFTDWLEPSPKGGTVRVYQERKNSRVVALKLLKDLLAQHFVGAETISKLGFKKSADVIKNSLPTKSKATRSGDLGELLTAEFIEHQTNFRVPIRRLQFKDDREMPMRGTDVIAVEEVGKKVRVLKAESKSRAQFSSKAVEDAAESLDAHDCRPNPSSLAFITKRLFELGRDKEAGVFVRLQATGAIRPADVTHLLFAFCGANPSTLLGKRPKAKFKQVTQMSAGVVVKDHQQFIADVYKTHGA